MAAKPLKCLEPLTPTKVTTKKVLFIKLGNGGKWESDCILKSNTLRLGYYEADFRVCSKGDWNKIKKDYSSSFKNKGVASGDVTQIECFFQEPEDTIWITFFNNKLWWTKAKTKVFLEKDGTKTRSCFSEWSDKDIRGTICVVKAKDYLLRKINAEKSDEVLSTEESYKNLKANLYKLYQSCLKNQVFTI